LVVGMTSLIRRAKYKPDDVDPRLAALLSRKPVRLVTVALANKTARVIWAIMARGGTYRMPAAANTALIGLAAVSQNNRLQRLRGRCDVMANRSVRGRGQPVE